MTTSSFIKDLLKMLDEIKTSQDITEMWHIDARVAEKVFEIFQEVIFSSQNLQETGEAAIGDVSADYDTDYLDTSSDSICL